MIHINRVNEMLVNEELDNNQYRVPDEILNEVKDMITKTIEKNGGEFDSFIDKFLKEPDSTRIEGLINDSDIYEFYLKWRNDIDEILNAINFYDEVPSKLNVFSPYDYIITSTIKALNYVVKNLKA